MNKSVNGAVRPSPFRLRRALSALAALTVGMGVLGTTSPAAAAPGGAADSFSRAVSGGWGAADIGGTWTLNDPSRFAVVGGVGTVTLTRDGMNKYANLPGGGIDNTALASIAVDKTPAGSGLYASVTARKMQAGRYTAVTRFMPNGSVNLVLKREGANWTEQALTREVTVPGVNGAPGHKVNVRVETVGASPTTVRAKVWQAGAAEPAGWTQTATDDTRGYQVAGNVGFYNFLSTASHPVTVHYDDVSAAYDPAPVPVPPRETPPPAPAPSPKPTPPKPSAPKPTTPAPPSTTTPAPPTGTTPPSTTTPTPPGASTPPGTSPPSAPTPSPGNGTDPVVPSSGRAADAAGSLPIGQARYTAPANAYYVSPTGSDTHTGTVTAPFKTVAQAIKKAPTGATIVLRQGVYHESVTIPASKTLTVQNYPGEVVWFDGSSQVTAWVADGDDWRLDGWTAEFDTSPTYTKGAPDGTKPGWGFVNANYPMAAHPDMVFIDGVAQQQVRSRDQVVPGTFYVDYAADRIYLGSDPTGHQVRSSDLSRALLIQGPKSTVRGIGFHRYAVSVPTKGALISTAPEVTIENVVVSDNATQGLFVGGRNLGEDNVIRHVTAERNGMLGIESSYADGLVMEGVRAVGNNIERFNNAPVSGGAKISRARDIVVRDSVFSDNLSTGLWFDESVYNATVTGNNVQRNTGNGIAYEISSKALIADNLITGNTNTGLKVNNASEMEIWNNTILDNTGRAVWLVQDNRVASNLSTPGHDPRQSLPDPTVTWLLGPITFNNNVVGGATTANCLLCVEDSALNRTEAQIGVTVDGNVYQRDNAASPRWSVVWATGAKNPSVYTTHAAFTKAEGQDAHGAEVVGSRPWDADYVLTTVPGATAQQPSSTVAKATGHDTKRLGAWLN